MVYAHARSQAEFVTRSVVPGGKAHRIRRAVEEQEEAVAAVDLLPILLREQLPRSPVVLGPQFGSARIAKARDQRGAFDQIGE